MVNLGELSLKELNQELCLQTQQLGNCLIWTGIKINGYAVICKNSQRYRVSRLIGYYHLGLLENPSLFVLHKCDNPSCVRLEHLFLGDTSDNKQDEIRKGHNFESKKLVCPQGHEYSVENTIRYKNQRWCKICRRAATNRWNDKQKNKRRLLK